MNEGNTTRDMLQSVFETAAWVCRKKTEGEDYDPGKYGIHVEEVEKGIFGVYEQTEDSPDGDTWEAWLISTRGGSVEVVSHISEGERFWDDEFFANWLEKMPRGRVK